MTNPADTTNTVAAAPAVQKRRGRPVKADSGLSKARAAYASLPAGTTRQAAIAEFVKLGLTKETSAAYYSVITRKAKAS
jgi:hypothetical protein